MNLPETIHHFLEQTQLPYRLVSVSSGQTLEQIAEELEISIFQIARAILLRDDLGLVMVVLPCNHILDFSEICRILQRDLEPLYGAESTKFYQRHGCVAGCQPPLAKVFDVMSLADMSLGANETEEIFFDGGSGNTMVGMRGHNFRKLLNGTRWEHFAVSVNDLNSQMSQQLMTPQSLTDFSKRYTPMQLREGIEAITDLPVLPQTAQQLLALRSHPDLVTTDDILQIIGQDPSLAAQIIYGARSPLHGYSGSTSSLKKVIEEVLGFENTLNLLLGSSVGQTFNIPHDGPVGLRAFWRHSVYAAALTSELSKLLPESANVKPELAYLCGLLHDFGYLVLGHVFPARFFLFNRFLAVNRNIPREVVERYVLGVEHWHIGAWLMQSWAMPEEVIAAVRWHHNEDCTQPHAEYSNLVLIANRLLDRVGLGENAIVRLPTLAMFTLGITREQALETLERVQSSVGALDDLSVALNLPSDT